MFEPQIRQLKSVRISAWTCDSLSWFQSTVVFTNNEFSNCSVWAVGTMKHLVLLVVRNWRILGLNVAFFLGGPEECFCGEGWDRSLNSLVHTFKSLVPLSMF